MLVMVVDLVVLVMHLLMLMDVVAEVLAFANRHGADGVVTSTAVDPRLQKLAAAIEAEVPLQELEPDPFVALPRPPRLGRFSRYWREAESVVWESYSPAG